MFLNFTLGNAAFASEKIPGFKACLSLPDLTFTRQDWFCLTAVREEIKWKLSEADRSEMRNFASLHADTQKSGGLEVRYGAATDRDSNRYLFVLLSKCLADQMAGGLVVCDRQLRSINKVSP